MRSALIPYQFRVDLIPSQAVTGHLRKGVMIVVPAFAKGQDRDPETVRGIVAGHKALRSPHVRGGIYEPGGVESEHGADKRAPQQVGQSAEDEQEDAHDNFGNPVPRR